MNNPNHGDVGDDLLQKLIEYSRPLLKEAHKRGCGAAFTASATSFFFSWLARDSGAPAARYVAGVLVDQLGPRVRKK